MGPTWRLTTAFSVGFFAALLAVAPSFARESAVPVETLRVPGLKAAAEIRIDRWGVAHIYAKNEADLFFAQGFNAARDRLFQIDLWRRRGLGQLAEVFGPTFVEQDRAARLFLYRGDMDREWRIYSARRTRELEPIAQRFVAGINAYVNWLDAHPDRMPWEFAQFGYKPARWTAEDVVRIRSHGITRNLGAEVARANTLCKTKSVEADTIRSGLSNGWKAQLPDGLDPCLPPDVLKVFGLATDEVRVTPEGSNSWVVAPSKSATGRAIMANDPHREYFAPSLRYIAHLCAPGLDVIGAGEPALPGISLGHNGTIAFGLTIFDLDQQDLYAYELDGDGSAYKYGGGWEPLRVIRESVAVKGEAARRIELVFTRHGPVVHLDQQSRRAFAVRSAWLEPGMSPYFGSLEYMRARDFRAFKAALVNWGTPPMNQVYADAKGNIGWAAAGFAPKRPNWDGLLPVPGDGRFEWAGAWRGNELPSLYNPAKGFIASGNAYSLPDDYPALERKLGFEWTNPSRQQRIHEVLGGLDKVTLEDSQRLQNDVLSIPARRLTALLAPLSSADAKTQRALDFLRGWDARLGADSPQAALEEVWNIRHLRKAFREAVLKPEDAAALRSTDMNVMLAGLENPDARFGENPAAKRDQVLLATLKAAWEEMEGLQGPEPSTWQWGKLHQNVNEHPFAAAVDDAMRARINVGPIATNGSEHTPNQSLPRAKDFRQMVGPSVRVVVDVGNWDNSRAVNHPGQSGDPASPHYRDLAPLWVEGRYFPLLYTRKAVEGATERVIRMLPQH
jgi:penicillin amidase